MCRVCDPENDGVAYAQDLVKHAGVVEALGGEVCPPANMSSSGWRCTGFKGMGEG